MNMLDLDIRPPYAPCLGVVLRLPGHVIAELEGRAAVEAEAGLFVPLWWRVGVLWAGAGEAAREVGEGGDFGAVVVVDGRCVEGALLVG